MLSTFLGLKPQALCLRPSGADFQTLLDTEEGTEILVWIFDGRAPLRRIRKVEERKLLPEIRVSLRKTGAYTLVDWRFQLQSKPWLSSFGFHFPILPRPIISFLDQR